MPRDRRLYLFDIDSTLINSGGAGGSAMRAAFTALWRDAKAFEGVELHGGTDRSLLKQALDRSDAAHENFEEALARFKRAYYRRLPATLRSRNGRVLPGVVQLLNHLARDNSATLGLGTGNFRASAGVKLAHFGLRHHFRLGGFGDHTEERAEVIAAGTRAGRRAAGKHATVLVIGDTPLDIKAAKDNAAIAVGVATGIVDEAGLSRAGADIVLATLEDAAAILPQNH